MRRGPWGQRGESNRVYGGLIARQQRSTSAIAPHNRTRPEDLGVPGFSMIPAGVKSVELISKTSQEAAEAHSCGGSLTGCGTTARAVEMIGRDSV